MMDNKMIRRCRGKMRMRRDKMSSGRRRKKCETSRMRKREARQEGWQFKHNGGNLNKAAI